MPELPVHSTDAAIRRLLADGPLPTAAIAGRLAIPERTARHRLVRLRQTGDVVTGMDGLHRLAAAVPSGGDGPTSPSPAAGRRWGMLAAAGFGLAVAGGVAVLLIRRAALSPQEPAKPPSPWPGLGYPGNPWRGWP
ncbi:MAG TPA: winged helix-turn-helix domain-containing protein [Candidatus Saccharimonadales bacterium]|nr:winged helix-turn-helix domain-containing protein [Candidatus Saccharimonadales bacterium]